MTILGQVKGFFEAHGSVIQEKDTTLIIAEEPSIANEIERTCVWILTQEERKGRDPIIVEEDYLARFKGIAKRFPGARLHLLVDTMEALSANFRARAVNEFRVRVQVPAQFFDMPFSWEVARSTASATKALSNSAKYYEDKRISQAYMKRDSGQVGRDLVADLIKEMDAAIEAPQGFIWFIIAPAGQGKSIGFAALFEQLFSSFLDHKRRYQPFPRPLPLVSAHLKESAGPNVGGLIDAFIRTEFAAHSRREFFNWLIDNRCGLLMLDGLDELITRDANFLEYLEDRVTAPYSQPGIIISMRDSLFETSDDLSSFIHDYASFVSIYELRPWDRAALRLHAWINLEGHKPKASEPDTVSVTKYLGMLDRNPGLKSLTSIPFYADLLVQSKLTPAAGVELSEQDLIELAIEKMCSREYEKGTLNRDVFPPRAFREWLEEIAILSYQTSGVSVQELRDLAGLAAVLASRDLSEEEQKSLVDHLTMAPFFKKSDMSGRLELTHELLAEYLAASRFVDYYQNNSSKFAYSISQRPWPADSIMYLVLARALKAEIDGLAKLSVSESLSPDGFRNVVQLLARMPGGVDILREKRIALEGGRLQGVCFRDANLEGISFQSADLTNARFINCSLRTARFEGAVLDKTAFEKIPEKGLELAEFGNCEHFESILVEGRLIDDYERFRKWILKQTGQKEIDAGPCPSTRQLLFLFRKFIHVDGQGRRDVLDRRGVLRGKQEPAAASSEDCLRACLEFGYLEEEHGQRIRRSTGTKYGEAVSFVKNQSASANIRSLLDSLCRIPGCPHLPGRKPDLN